MKLRVGVVGVGPMGRGHVKHYRGLPGCDLVAVVDSDPARRAEAAVKSGARAFADFRELIGRVDAVSIATPTTTHRDIALPLIDAGVHVLIEKPLAQDPAAGEEIVRAARERGVVLQVGHIERFNPAFRAAQEVISDPRYVVCDRLSTYSFRSRDIGVVLDLMIHDLDILLTFLRHEVVSLEAIGIPVLSPSEDMCDARLRFADGALADVRASRVSMKRMRKIRLFQSNAYVSIDYDAKKISIFRKGERYAQGELDPLAVDPTALDDPFGFVFGELLDVREHEIATSDALRDELSSFLGACRGEHPPEVPGEDGLRAVRLADRIRRDVRTYLEAEAARAGIPLPEQDPTQ
ncbi:MAG: gfo/Idh/MocA family oxidoreductase [Planctomycetota bacterium]|nr:MAG: gfo/Idh/MocA family oxidoreductase [Planctomycetota bacterium]